MDVLHARGDSTSLMPDMNPFRILGDVSHIASKCILIWAIHRNKSAEGVSLITQALYMAVFVCRYLDLLWVPPTYSWWNFVIKIFYIASSIYIIVIMMRVVARTREREKAWKLGGYATGGSLVLAPLVAMIFRGLQATTPFEISWTFSIILESVCVLPQLLLLRQTTVPTVIDSFYLLALGSYRAFYLVNWIVRGVTEHRADPVAIIFGAVQTAFYIDFAWVYFTRQRVKLRGGGIVDSDDLRKGFLVNRVINVGKNGTAGDEEAILADSGGPASVNGTTTKGSRWGARGISVSADDSLDEHQQRHAGKSTKHDVGGSQQESTAMLAEDDDLFSDGDDDAEILPKQSKTVLNSENEWGEHGGHGDKGPRT